MSSYQVMTEFEKRQEMQFRQLQGASFAHYMQQAQVARQTHQDITMNTDAILGLGEGFHEIAYQMNGIGAGLSNLGSGINMMGYSIDEMGHSVNQMGYSINQMDTSINRLGLAFMNHFKEVEQTNAERYEQINRKVAESVSLLSEISLQMYSGYEILQEINQTQRKMYSDLQESISNLHETIKNDYKKWANEKMNMGMECVEKKLLAEAAEAFEEAISFVKIDPMPHYFLGKIYAFGIDDDNNMVNYPLAAEHLRLTMRYCKNQIASNREMALLYSDAASILAKVYFLQAKLEEVSK